MTEISRRTFFGEDGGMACGPMCITEIDAEITVQDGSEVWYLFAQWVDAADDTIDYEASKESLFDVYVSIMQIDDYVDEIMENADEDDDIDEGVLSEERYDMLMEKRDSIEAEEIGEDSRFSDYRKHLKQMILQVMEEHDIDPECLEEENEEDE